MSSSRFAFNRAALFACAAAIALASAISSAQDPAPSTQKEAPSQPQAPSATFADQLTREIRGVVEKAQSAVCRIEAADEHSTLRGTGFLVDADGTILTSYSVGGQSENIVVTIGEEKYPATRKSASERCGLAILQIDTSAPLPFLQCGKSLDLAVGSPVVSLGFPLDLPLSPSLGLIAGKDLKFQNRYFSARHLRVNVVVQRGQGGSPILDLQGNLVGVVISTVENGSGAFALPVEAVKKVLHDVEEHGRMRQGYLGADVRRTDAREFGSSARVRNVRFDGPGHRGGLRPGDVLLQIGDRTITDPEDVLDASFYITADEPLKVQVARAGKKVDLTVTPTDPPSSAQSLPIEQDAASIIGSNGPMGLGTGR